MQLIFNNLAQSLAIPETQEVLEPSQQNDSMLDLANFFEIIFYALNYFSLAFSCFFTIIFLIDFFNNRVFNSGGELALEKPGVSSINSALRLWYRYYLVLTFLIFYSLFKQTFLGLILAFFGVLSVFYKLREDVLEILDIITYFSFVADITKEIKSILDFKK
jgi:hypothetical protein